MIRMAVGERSGEPTGVFRQTDSRLVTRARAVLASRPVRRDAAQCSVFLGTTRALAPTAAKASVTALTIAMVAAWVAKS